MTLDLASLCPKPPQSCLKCAQDLSPRSWIHTPHINNAPSAVRRVVQRCPSEDYANETISAFVLSLIVWALRASQTPLLKKSNVPASIQMRFEGILHAKWCHSPCTAFAAPRQRSGAPDRSNPAVPPWEAPNQLDRNDKTSTAIQKLNYKASGSVKTSHRLAWLSRS